MRNEKPKILVVDDERLYIDMLVELLQDSYKVVVAKDGEQAIRRAIEVPPPDLILLDCLMPGLDGLEVCRILKKTPETSKVPIIFLTIKSDVADEINGFSAGAVDYIRKPLSPPIVKARVSTHLALANQRQSLEQLVKERTKEISKLHQQAVVSAEQLERHVKERTAELEAVNHELESFSYSVSHDLRAPLRSIDGFSLALVESYQAILDEQGMDYLNRIRSASQRMRELINDLLDLSKVSRCPLNQTPVDLTNLAQAVVQHLQNDTTKPLAVSIQNGMQARGDFRLLRVVLENLLGNACKFTVRNPSPSVQFGCRQENDGDVFFVKDNGVGFDPEYAHKLFKPFQRLHDISEFEGTGIGLATVNRIIQRHGGKVWANSILGQGAEFNFTLPS